MFTSSSSSTTSEKKNKLLPAAVTDIGCEREINEDRYAVMNTAAGTAWIVCDGMGGQVGGELAAQLAIDAIRRSIDSKPAETSAEAINAAVYEANRVIVLRRQNPSFASMGTTVVSAMLNGDEVAITHVGDSRAYLIRGNAIQQLTVDHTYVQELVDKGEITYEESLTHPQAHVLTRCLGAASTLELATKDYWLWPLAANEEGDKLLLCSDGLYSLVEEGEIAEIAARCQPQDACARFVELARDRGGYDNITVAIIPLDGKLHEEPSAQTKERIAKQNKYARFNVEYKPVSIGRRLMMTSLFTVLGSISSVFYLFLNLLGS